MQQNLICFESNRVVQRKETHVLLRTQVANVRMLCVRKRQASIKRLVKQYRANVVELIFKIAVL